MPAEFCADRVVRQYRLARCVDFAHRHVSRLFQDLVCDQSEAGLRPKPSGYRACTGVTEFNTPGEGQWLLYVLRGTVVEGAHACCTFSRAARSGCALADYTDGVPHAHRRRVRR